MELALISLVSFLMLAAILLTSMIVRNTTSETIQQIIRIINETTVNELSDEDKAMSIAKDIAESKQLDILDEEGNVIYFHGGAR